MASRLSDLVVATKIRVEFHADQTHRFKIESGTTSGRFVRRKERCDVWKTEQELGQGAFGNVWVHRCLTSKGQPEVQAVKTIDKRQMAANHIDYHRELEAIAKFSLEKYRGLFVEYICWYESDDKVFIAMEHIEHGDLDSHLTQPLPEAEAREITAQILEGLETLHENQFAHRDLKPANIFVVQPAPGWWVKIRDFGISKRVHANTGLRTEVGTRLFLAPEVQMLYPPHVDEGSMFIYTNKVDIWSLGVITFYMLFHEYPLTLAKPTVLPIYVRGGPFPFPSNIQVSHECYEFMKTTMAADASLRSLATEALASDWLKQSPPELSDDDSETAIFNTKSSTSTHDSLESCYTRGLELLQQGEYSTAQRLLQQVVDGWSQSLGPAHGDVIDASFALCDTYRRLGDDEKAEKFLRRALDYHQDQLGLIDDTTHGVAAHPRTTIWELLGSGEAEIFLREAVRSAKQIYGPDSPKTLKLLFWRGQALYKLGIYTQAKAIHEEVLKIRKETLGPSHPETLEAMETLCNIQGSDFRGTESLWRELVDLRKEALGPRHPGTLATMREFGLFLEHHRKFGKAVLVLEEVKIGYRKTLGKDDNLTRATRQEYERCLKGLRVLLDDEKKLSGLAELPG